MNPPNGMAAKLATRAGRWAALRARGLTTATSVKQLRDEALQLGWHYETLRLDLQTMQHHPQPLATPSEQQVRQVLAQFGSEKNQRLAVRLCVTASAVRLYRRRYAAPVTPTPRPTITPCWLLPATTPGVNHG